MAYTTLSDIFTSARFRTGTSTSDFADTNAGLMSLTNKYFRRIVTELVDLNEDCYATISTASLSSGINAYTIDQDSTTFGGGTKKLLRLEMTHDGSNWHVATPIDMEQIGVGTALTADINNEFSPEEPFYSVFGNTLRIFPVPTTDVSGGLRLFQVQRQREISNSSNVFGDATGSSLQAMLPKEFMEPLEDFITADIYERIGKTQEAIAARQGGENAIARLKQQFSRRNEDFDLNVGTNAYEDYGE